uniref:Uncharacterized protein n=1 Tax=Daucus carota subsp. sativus TaxID=79200 RepID=A0A161XZ85_DAUCS
MMRGGSELRYLRVYEETYKSLRSRGIRFPGRDGESLAPIFTPPHSTTAPEPNASLAQKMYNEGLCSYLKMGSGSSSVDEDSEVTMYQNVKRNSTYQVVALGVLDKETQTLRLCQSLLIRILNGTGLRVEWRTNLPFFLPNFEGSDTTQDEAQQILKDEDGREKRLKEGALQKSKGLIIH